MDRFEMQERLVRFSAMVIGICDQLKKNHAGLNLSKQLTRSSVSPALNYAEAQDAESDKDFVHKLKIALKELRETHAALQIIEITNLCMDSTLIAMAVLENNELIAILVASIKTKKANLQASNKPSPPKS